MIHAPTMIKDDTTIPTIAPTEILGPDEPLEDEAPNAGSIISCKTNVLRTFCIEQRSIGCTGRGNVVYLPGRNNIPLKRNVLRSGSSLRTEPRLERLSQYPLDKKHTLSTLNAMSPEFGILLTLVTSDESVAS